MKKRRLYVSRMDIGQMLASSTTGQVTVSLECWRYTLEVYSGTDKEFQVNGFRVGLIVVNVNGAGFPMTYSERIGGATGQENDVKEQIVFTTFTGTPVNAALYVERWMETD